MTGWSYAAGDGGARVARIDSVAPLFIAGALGHARLELVDDPEWGPRLHVHLHAGEADARTGRRVEVTLDDAPPFEVPASRPPGAPRILSLRDPRALREAIAGATVLHLRVPVRHQGRPRIAFAVAGLDLSRLQAGVAAD